MTNSITRCILQIELFNIIKAKPIDVLRGKLQGHLDYYNYTTRT